MTNNDVLRRLRYALDIKDKDCVKLFCLHPDFQVILSIRQLKQRLLKPEQEGFVTCSDIELNAFLEGLIVKHRGLKKDRVVQPLDPETFHLNTNEMLRKLRIALNLKDVDMLAILKKGGSKLSKSELSAFFRNSEHKHYRKAGGQTVRNFLTGLAKNKTET